MTVELRQQRVELPADGIVRVRVKSGANIDTPDAEECVRAMLTLIGGSPLPALIDMTQLRSISDEARAYLSGPATEKVARAAAMVVSSPLSRAVGNIFLVMNKTRFPTRMFTSEDDAVQWLRGYL
jgi:hypothetical protein